MDAKINIRHLRQQGRAYLAKHLPSQSTNVIGLESDVLLCAVLGCSDTSLLIRMDETVDEDQSKRFWSLLERRANCEPIAYLIGEKEFFGRKFICNSSTLIPRPDTELLVELLVDRCKKIGAPEIIHDLACGSGCIGLSVAAEIKNLGWCGTMFLSDISPPALAVAMANSKKHQLENCTEFFCSDLLSANAAVAPVIISNLPYISTSEVLMPDVDKFEPKTALRSGIDGLDHIRALLADWSQRAGQSDTLYLEIGESQRHAVESLARKENCAGIEFYQDLSGTYRVVEIRR